MSPSLARNLRDWREWTDFAFGYFQDRRLSDAGLDVTNSGPLLLGKIENGIIRSCISGKLAWLGGWILSQRILAGLNGLGINYRSVGRVDCERKSATRGARADEGVRPTLPEAVRHCGSIRNRCGRYNRYSDFRCL